MRGEKINFSAAAAAKSKAGNNAGRTNERSGIAFPYIKKDLYEQSGIAGYKVGPVPLIALGGLISTICTGLLMYGVLSSPGFLIYIPSSLSSTITNYGIAFSLFIGGFIIYFASMIVRRRQGIDFRLIFATIPPE